MRKKKLPFGVCSWVDPTMHMDDEEGSPSKMATMGWRLKDGWVTIAGRKFRVVRIASETDEEGNFRCITVIPKILVLGFKETKVE